MSARSQRGRRHGGAAAIASLEGRHPCLFFAERRGQLAPTGDLELGVGAREMALDRLERDVELVGDLAICAAFGRQPRDAKLARRQRLDALAPRTSRSRADGVQFLAYASGQWRRSTARGEVERLAEEIARLGALAGPAKRGA